MASGGGGGGGGGEIRTGEVRQATHSSNNRLDRSCRMAHILA